MVIDSTKVTVNASQEEVFNFLKDMRNIIHLLPQDKISDFKATEGDCSFKVQGGVIISLLQNGDEGHGKIKMKSGEKSPFPFELIVNTTTSEGGTEGYLHFDGEVNMFLKIMVEKPLTALFNYMSNELAKQFAE